MSSLVEEEEADGRVVCMELEPDNGCVSEDELDNEEDEEEEVVDNDVEAGGQLRNATRV